MPALFSIYKIHLWFICLYICPSPPLLIISCPGQELAQRSVLYLLSEWINLGSRRFDLQASPGVSTAHKALSAVCAHWKHPMAGTCALVLLKHRVLGLAFQKSQQEAAGHLSHQPRCCTAGNPAQRGEVICLADLQGSPPTPSSGL